MNALLPIYECFSDLTRLRILHLLREGPLCVCHFQELLDEPQVKISKHLSYLKSKRLVEARRHQNWMVYSLQDPLSDGLRLNLECLATCVAKDPVFKDDLRKRKRLQRQLGWMEDLTECDVPSGRC